MVLLRVPVPSRSRLSAHDCAHDHGGGWLKREASHMREHWFSCLASCVVIHLALDAVSWLWSLR